MAMMEDKGKGPMLLYFLPLPVVIMMSFVGNGSAGVTSAFVRSDFPSPDMPLDNEAFAVPIGKNAPQQVHITQGDYEGKAVIISWVTPDEPGSSQVRYGPSEKKYAFIAEATMTNYTFSNYTSGYIHHCLLDGLEYDTEYFYEVGEGLSIRQFSFQTPPKIDPDTPYTFGIIGDLGQTFNSFSTLEHYMKHEGQAVLYVGDLSYADKYQYSEIGVRWDTWGRMVEPSTAYQPWLWSVGNHEVECLPLMGEPIPFKSYLHRYPTPYAASNSTSPLWYAVKRASAHIIVLCSYCAFATYTPQWIWLYEELQRVDREKTPWLFVIIHIPMYSSNELHYMEGESMRVEFEKWFVQHKVDVVFAGHVHAYERSYRYSNIQYNVSGGYPYPVPDKSAPIHMTIGDGGNIEGLAANYTEPQPNYSAFREASYGHSILEIKNRTVAVYHWYRNVDHDHEEADSLIIYNQYYNPNSDGKRRKAKKNHIQSAIADLPVTVGL